MHTSINTTYHVKVDPSRALFAEEAGSRFLKCLDEQREMVVKSRNEDLFEELILGKAKLKLADSNI